MLDEVKRLRNMKKYLVGQEGSEKAKENEELSFVPRSYIMPEDYEKLRKVSMKEAGETWIIKSVSVIIRDLYWRNFGKKPVGDIIK